MALVVFVSSVSLVVLVSWWLWVVVSFIIFCVVVGVVVVVLLLMVGVSGVGVVIMVGGRRCVVGSLSSLLVGCWGLDVPTWLAEIGDMVVP